MAKYRKDYRPETKPVFRFFLNNAGVFELICKSILAVLIIPYGSLIMCGLIFDKLFHLVDGNDICIIAICILVLGLLGFGIYLAVYAIKRYADGSGRKRISAPGESERDGQ